MSEPPFRRLGIVGLGLIGGSIALRARATWPGMTLIGCDRSEQLAQARTRGIAEEYVADLSGVASADVIVLAVPVPVMVEMMPRLAALRTRAVVTDVGSTKRQVMHEAQHAGLTRFVGGHPMSGSEHAGLAHARADLFEGRPWMLVRGGGEPASWERDVETFTSALGGVPQWIDAETHDRVVAYISHVPQLLAVALMNATVEAVGDRGLAASGRAFREMTRLASSPADLWQGILAGNVDNVTIALRHVMERLPVADDLVGGRWVAEAFARAHLARTRLTNGDLDSE